MQAFGKLRWVWAIVVLSVVVVVLWASSAFLRRRENETAAFASAETVEPITSGMRQFLDSEEARLHCCTRQSYRDAARRHETSAASLPTDDRAVLAHLKMAAYLFLLSGNPERARLSMMKVGELARGQGATLVAASAYLEAAQIAIAAENTRGDTDSNPQR